MVSVVRRALIAEGGCGASTGPSAHGWLRRMSTVTDYAPEREHRYRTDRGRLRDRDHRGRRPGTAAGAVSRPARERGDRHRGRSQRQRARVGRRPRLYGLYQGSRGRRWPPMAAAIPEQDHDLPRSAHPRLPDAGTASRRRSPTPSTTRSPTTSGSPTRGSTSCETAAIRRSRRVDDRTAPTSTRPSSRSTTGRIRSTHSGVLRAARVEAVVGHERSVLGGAERDVEDVDKGDRPRPPASRAMTALSATIAVVLPARVAVVGTGGRHRVVGDGDRHDAAPPGVVPAARRGWSRRCSRTSSIGTPCTTSLTPISTVTNSGSSPARAGQLVADQVGRRVAVDRRGWRPARRVGAACRGPPTSRSGNRSAGVHRRADRVRITQRHVAQAVRTARR